MCFLLCFLCNAELTSTCIRRGLRLCAQTVIPSLFPCMVLAEILIASGFGEWLGRLLARPMQKVFGISGASSSAVLLGALCGFPIGTRAALALYKRGSIDRGELEHLLTFCNNTSIAFTVSAVGNSLYGSQAFGVGLCCIQLFCALLIGILGRRRGMHPSSVSRAEEPAVRLDVILTQAISGSALAMLYICAYVVFFSALVGIMDDVLLQKCGIQIPPGLLFGLFELSSGVSAAASEPLMLGAVLCAFTVGWSGAAVHCQIFSLLAQEKVSLRPYLAAKILQGILCAALTFLWLSFCPPADLRPTGTVPVFSPLPSAYLLWSNLLFLAALLLPKCRKKQKIR
ncbi:MAG: hypothetical protein IKD37_09715 [Clostridia bacterium]|nr:hypothetical protein [Clostridia bacterium]